MNKQDAIDKRINEIILEIDKIGDRKYKIIMELLLYIFQTLRVK